MRKDWEVLLGANVVAAGVVGLGIIFAYDASGMGGVIVGLGIALLGAFFLGGNLLIGIGFVVVHSYRRAKERGRLRKSVGL